MRLLVVCENFTGGGLETHIVSTFRNLKKKDAEIFLATSPGYNRALLDGLVKEVLELDLLDLRGARIVAGAVALREFIEEHGIQVAHLHPFYAFWAGYLAAVSAGIPYVCTLHAPWVLSAAYGLAHHIFQKHYLFRQASALFVVSPELERRLRTLGMQTGPQPIILPNAVDTRHFAPAKGTVAAENRVSIISRLDADKLPGVRNWLNFCRQLSDVLPALTGTVVGDGPERAGLEREIQASPLKEKISFLGFVNDPRAVMTSSRLVAGMGRVVLEAAAMDIPAVLVGYDEVKTLVDRENFQTLADTNFSGRGVLRDSDEQLLGAIRECLHEATRKYSLRDLVTANHDARQSAHEYWGVLSEVVDLWQPLKYTAEIRDQAELLAGNLRTIRASLFDALDVLDIFPRRVLETELPAWNLQESVKQLLAQKERDRQGLQIRLAAEQEAHQKTYQRLLVLGEELAAERRQLAAARDAHEKTHQQQLALGEELAGERRQLALEREGHQTTYQRLLALGEELAGEKALLEAERQAHLETHHQLAAADKALAQTQELMAAEREAHHQTYRQLLAVGDELVQERHQLGVERQKHNETLTALHMIYASRGWRWLERYRRFRRTVLLGNRHERRSYFRSAARRLAGAVRYGLLKPAAAAPNLPSMRSGASGARETVSLPIPIRSSRSVEEGRRELRAILESHPDAAIIVYPPTVDWNYPLFQRPHHLALGLARRGCLFFYMSPNLHDRVDGIRQVAGSVYVINLPVESLSTLPQDKTVLFISWAANYVYRDLVPHRLLVYDYLDTLDLSETPDPRNSVLHMLALKNAGLVLVTARNLYAEAKELSTRVVLCPNGVDFDRFARTSEALPEDLSDIASQGRPVIGYYGALAKWFDYALLRACAKEYPEWDFVLLGLDYDGSLRESGVTHISNVRYLGSRKYEELPACLRAFSVATIPFRINKTTVCTNPIKLFEYMAAGKPIVTTALPECRSFQSVLWSEDQESYLANLQRAVGLREDPAYLSLLAREARENTWEQRIEQVMEALFT